MSQAAVATETETRAAGTAFVVLAGLSFGHFLNDMMQSLIPAIYPMLKGSFDLDFGQVGIITLVYQCTASLLQPAVGLFTDRRPKPFSLAAGMGFTLVGLGVVALASSFGMLLLGAALVGMGSSVFHPESSRIARVASGGRPGLAQSVFQVGGNVGSAVGPLLAAFIILPHGQISVAWFGVGALIGMVVLGVIGAWYKRHGVLVARPRGTRATPAAGQPTHRVGAVIALLIVLVFSKYFYLASITSYYTFYLIETFHVSVQSAQIHLFVFLGAVAVGTIVGGPLGDRFGRKYVIWFSILGVLPFTLALPHVGLFWTGILSVPIGLILASAFPAIIVYAQELVPGKVGTISGLFFGIAFGLGGLGAAVLGQFADLTSIGFVYDVCAFLPALGLLAGLLPNLEAGHRQPAAAPHPAPAE
ncbi:MAG TPA: MFS transporter [Hyphomicrobiales bacterium]|nr:MFS transporter [Hyphomicrobiales bacterium]